VGATVSRLHNPVEVAEAVECRSHWLVCLSIACHGSK